MGAANDKTRSTPPLLKRRISVNTILGLTGVLASLLLVFLFLILATVNFSLHLRESLESESSTIVNRLSLSISKAFWDLDQDSVQQIIAGEMGSPDLAFVQLTKPDGAVFVEVAHSPSGIRPPGQSFGAEELDRLDYLLEKKHPVSFSGMEIGQITIRLSSAARLASFTQDMAAAVAAQLLISCLVIVFILAVVQRLIIRPLILVTRVLEQFARQDFHSPAPEFSSLEMNSMGKVLNHMAQTITTYQDQMEKLVELRTAQLLESAKFAQMGVFMTGLAHEMNTPLGNSVLAVSFLNERVQAFEKDCQNGMVHYTALQAFFADLKQAGQLAYRGVERASQFINVLKTLGLDDKPHGVRAVRIDNFLAELVSTFRVEAEGKNLRLESQAEMGLSLKLHAAILYQVLTNLIFLALDYGQGTGEPGSIVCTAQFDRGILTVQCQDSRLFLDGAQLDHLFSPFGLSGESLGKRNAKEPVLRQSLGPFILQSLLKSVQGDLKASSEPEKGTLFVVTLPAEAVDITAV